MSDKPKKPAPPKEPDFSDVDRIAGKIEAALEGGVKSTTATYADKVFTSIKNKSFQKPDRISALNNLILEFIEIKNYPSWNGNTKKDLITYLDNQKGRGIIDTIKNGIIEWTDPTSGTQDSPINGLKKRYDRMVKKYHEGVRYTPPPRDEQITDLDKSPLTGSGASGQ